MGAVYQRRTKDGRFAENPTRPGTQAPLPSPRVRAQTLDSLPADVMQAAIDRVNAQTHLLLSKESSAPAPNPPRVRFSRGADNQWRDEATGLPASRWSTLHRAYHVSASAHHGQYDKLGVPYEHHPRGVVDCLQALPHYQHLSIAEQRDAVVAAYLHDTLEDTPLTVQDLRDLGFTPRSIEIVEALTTRAGETRDDYYQRVKDAGSVAIAVKIADLTHNTLPARRAHLPGSPAHPVADSRDDAYTRLGRKYAKAFLTFNAALPVHLQEYAPQET